jgi:hypothetical protein
MVYQGGVSGQSSLEAVSSRTCSWRKRKSKIVGQSAVRPNVSPNRALPHQSGASRQGRSGLLEWLEIVSPLQLLTEALQLVSFYIDSICDPTWYARAIHSMTPTLSLGARLTQSF